ncbi:hypothetical protein [Cytobacillus purgationiresistens]|nr:hypothetical protein [Cytobacillus purgationiresistens]
MENKGEVYAIYEDESPRIPFAIEEMAKDSRKIIFIVTGAIFIQKGLL